MKSAIRAKCKWGHLPREAAGGEPLAKRSEERAVEGASGKRGGQIWPIKGS